MNEDLFDNYLLGHLNKSEIEEFENKIKQNEDLRLAFLEHKKTINAIQYKSIVDLKTELKSHHKNTFGADKKNHLLYIIGGLLLSAIAAWFVLQSQVEKKPTNAKQLYATHYEDFPIPGSLRNDSTSNLYESIHSDYVNGNYVEVVNALSAEDEEDLNLHYRLILACSQSNIEQDDLAEKNFKIVANSNNSRYNNIGNWYLALLLTKQNRLTEAETIFEKLSQTDSFYSEKAKQLLSDIR